MSVEDFNESAEQQGTPLGNDSINKFGEYIILPTIPSFSNVDPSYRIVSTFSDLLRAKKIPEDYPGIVQAIKEVIAEAQQSCRPYDVEKTLVEAGLRGPQPMFTQMFIESAQRHFNLAIGNTEKAQTHLHRFSFGICNHWAALKEKGIEAALTDAPTPTITTAIGSIKEHLVPKG